MIELGLERRDVGKEVGEAWEGDDIASEWWEGKMDEGEEKSGVSND